MPKPREIILWPEYFHEKLSRGKGRRVPKTLAVHNPTPDLFIEVCKELGFHCEVEENKRYPRVWHSSFGYRVVVRLNKESNITKEELIKVFAEKMREIKERVNQ